MNYEDIRLRVVKELRMLSLPSLQLEYEMDLANHAGHAPSELIEGFCTDIFSPKSADFVSAFSDSELKSLCHLYGLMIEASSVRHHTVSELLQDPSWRKVVALAKELHVQF